MGAAGGGRRSVRTAAGRPGCARHLRTEMGYPLHGQDLSEEITPVQARLGWAVGWTKDAFFGDDALRAERTRGPSRLLRGLKAVGRGIPRPGMTVYGAGGEEIGSVTSGTFSPTLKTGIALALPRLRSPTATGCLSTFGADESRS